mgnify:CR=1 FL=1
MLAESTKHTGPIVAICLVVLWIAFDKVVLPMWRAPQVIINDELRRRIDDLERGHREHGDRLTGITTAVGVSAEILKDLRSYLHE